ncbi:MAG: 2-isopropylmalate synthase [Clostridium sp.]
MHPYKNINEVTNVAEANLYRDIFPYTEIPKVIFDNKNIPMNMAKDVWITDTTFRDGQQSMSPFTVEQILTIYDYIHKLDNGSGIIRQSEFFLYTEKDREAVLRCMDKGYEFPQITAWIRAHKEDFKLVKNMNIKETGILMSCSDYHIFKKLNLDRQKAMDKYVEIAEEALAHGIIPRCHLEDITRADFFGFVVPLVRRLMELSVKANMPVKIRACDTLGLGVPHDGVALPRSVKQIMHGFTHYCNVPSEWIEWHGHNDFYSVVPNSTTAWLHGCCGISSTLFGIGERTGNCPLEAMVIEYGQLKGNIGKMDLTVLTEIGTYFEKSLGYQIPHKTPFVGSDFNVTKAGIHADGILKDEEIYNIFDTEKILNRPILVAVNEYSGLAGIAAWINTYFRLKGESKINKRDERVIIIKSWVDKEYASGRTSVIGNDELENIVKLTFDEISDNKKNEVIDYTTCKNKRGAFRAIQEISVETSKR